MLWKHRKSKKVALLASAITAFSLEVRGLPKQNSSRIYCSLRGRLRCVLYIYRSLVDQFAKELHDKHDSSNTYIGRNIIVGGEWTSCVIIIHIIIRAGISFRAIYHLK